MKPILTVMCAAVLSCVAGEAPENFAAKTELPSGPGLAKTWPADRNISSDRHVIFADGFESGDMSKWDEADTSKKDVFSFPDPAAPELGTRCLRVEAHLDRDTGGGPTKWFESKPRLFVRFYTRFAPDCDYVHHFVTLRANKGLRGGDKWSGFGGAGNKPAGDERFSTAIEPWGNWAKNPPPGAWNFYSYWHEMKPSGDKKYWGNSFMPAEPPLVPRDKWICVEFMLQHNTPGKGDGEQAFWIDGKLLGHWKGINWRKSPSLMANALTVESYITGNWTKHPVNTVSFDNIVVADAYIGPAAKP